MNNQDFERLKDLCEKEGFELLNQSAEDNEKFFVIAKKKDIWEGVEFAHFTNLLGKQFIEKIIRQDDLTIYFIDGYLEKKFAKPSTEQAYVEQLKKEAHRLFGEIKEGDRFDRSSINSLWEKSTIPKAIQELKGFTYNSVLDVLYYNGLAIYEKGKWAKKVGEKIKVRFSHWNIEVVHDLDPAFSVHFTLKNLTDRFDEDRVTSFLTKQLEKYLNDENC